MLEWRVNAKEDIIEFEYHETNSEIISNLVAIIKKINFRLFNTPVLYSKIVMQARERPGFAKH